eukprot:gnl/Trimastix_PCT/4167.p1 GENE.gnl/Trimastix_PCT/4167~~gnl/Trimastix_PCT/4167.p1  ORF type:complete len:183 (-),score=44.08 gnl/Trimastix_PCT/4167:142-690(-)
MQSVKIVVLGVEGVGKTSLIHRFLQSAFPPTVSPSLRRNPRKTLAVDGIKVSVEVIKPSSDQHHIADAIREGDVFIIVFALNQRSSFDDLKETCDLLFRARRWRRVPAIVVGNKSDLAERAFPDNWAESIPWAFPAFEASARTGECVGAVFHEAVRVHRGLRQGPALVLPSGCQCGADCIIL